MEQLGEDRKVFLRWKGQEEEMERVQRVVVAEEYFQLREKILQQSENKQDKIDLLTQKENHMKGLKKEQESLIR